MQTGWHSGTARCRIRLGSRGAVEVGSEVLPGHFASHPCGEEDLVSPRLLPSLLRRELFPVPGGRGAREERGWGRHHVHPQL